MKKILLLLLLFITGCSCTGDIITYQDGFDLTIPKEIIPFLINEIVPLKHFDYEGAINVASFSSENKYILAQNDNYLVSDAVGSFLAQFKENYINTFKQVQTLDKQKARFGKDELVIDPNTESVEYMRVVWDESGTRYSIQYRTFQSNGKTYYTYSYNTNIAITLEVPLMVIKGDKTNQLILICLPYDTKYEVHVNLTLDALTKKGTYLDESYYIYHFPQSVNHLSQNEKEEAIRSWYEKYNDGYLDNNHFYFTYFGERFELTFDVKKRDKITNQEVQAFQITYQPIKATS